MQRILLLEDDAILSETLTELLENEGFEIEHVSNGESALDITFNKDFNLLLLDVNVPFLNGFEFLQGLRESGNTTPAIFITALTDVASLSKGFDVGADDYIKKPFDFDELLIRIKALLRKSYNTYKNEITSVDFRFLIDTNELYKAKTFVPLSPYELEITKLLFQNINTTLRKEVIFEYLANGGEMSEGSLRVHINKLRKIGLSITTLKGIGYRLAT
ncbi:response regulator transcription factor [Sulfurimonas sp. SAG-AH-194-I05]|nr:response regulator transcription factor [Sulfurimonas sp. SAG-AH-194-I05]MDF1874465.1 response regulator transcription factor [Sulfurimonas sp. SAG-AH-194-I05]